MNNNKLTNLDKYFENIRSDFPILDQKINNNDLIYVDNGATTQKPQRVINKIVEFYSKYNSNIHRSAHSLADRADFEYENSREILSKFINCEKSEIVFTSGATQSQNMISNGLIEQINKGDEIVVTSQEHHANLVPWQEIAKKKGAILKIIPLNEKFELDLEFAKKIINKKTKIVSIIHISNVLGTINDVKEIGKLAKKFNSYFILDATQSAPHIKLDFKKLNCDALVFSAHKMCGPTGVGVLIGKEKFLDELNPSHFGGDMIDEVFLDKSTFQKGYKKLESGTPNICGVIAFGEAIKYLDEIGIKKIEKYEEELTKYFLEKSKEIKDLKIFGPTNYKKRLAVFSINIKGIHSHDLGTILNNYGIATRGGHHCAMPLHDSLNINSTTRISLYFYNTKSEIDKIIDVLKSAKKIYDEGKFLL